ncbi:unnamed protein product, partial [Heterotrigona itama]
MNKFQGSVKEKNCTNDENCWLDKLVAIDEDHTRRNGLHINEVEKLLNNIDTYIHTKSQCHCPVDSFK